MASRRDGFRALQRVRALLEVTWSLPSHLLEDRCDQESEPGEDHATGYANEEEGKSCHSCFLIAQHVIHLAFILLSVLHHTARLANTAPICSRASLRPRPLRTTIMV